MVLYLMYILIKISKCTNDYKKTQTDYGIVKTIRDSNFENIKKINEENKSHYEKFINKEENNDYLNKKANDSQFNSLFEFDLFNKNKNNNNNILSSSLLENNIYSSNPLFNTTSNILDQKLINNPFNNPINLPIDNSLISPIHNPLITPNHDPLNTTLNNPINNPLNTPNLIPAYNNNLNTNTSIPYYKPENNIVKNLPASTMNNSMLDNNQNNILNNPANTLLDNILIQKPEDKILMTKPENVINRINDSRKEMKYKNVSGEDRDLTGKEVDLKNDVTVEIREKEMQFRKNLGQKAGVYCDAKYPFHCRPILSPEARYLKEALDNTKRPRYIPETINVQNEDLVKTMELNLSTIPEFYREKPDSYNNLLKMISSKGIDDPKKLEGQKISGFPDPGYVIKSLEEGLTFHASVKKYLRTLLEKTRELINKAEEKMKELAGMLKRKRKDAEDLYVNMSQSKSISFQAEMKKQLLQLLEETMANDAEFHDTKDWIYKMRQGLSYNTS